MASPTTPSSSRRTDRSTSLALPVRRLWGVGEDAEKLLARLGIRTIGDLLWHLPTRYKDYSAIRPLRALKAGEEQSAVAVLGKASQRRTVRGALLTEVELREEDGTPSHVRASWFGRQFIRERFPEGARVRLAGKVAFVGRGLVFQQPAIEPADAPSVHTGRLVPIYHLTDGLKEGNVRRYLHTAIVGEPGRASAVVGELPEDLPEDIRLRHGLPPIAEALAQVHFPDDALALLAAKRRLGFGELLVLQLALGQRRARWGKDAKAPILTAPEEQVRGWLAALPFSLTGAQVRAFGEIRGDLGRTVPMSRLLEGDVGSGKTVVVALAARIAVAAGAQAALMAPTELLAEQHFRSLAELFTDGPSVELLSSSVSGARRREILARLAAGTLDVIVGTHALVEEHVVFHRLGLSIVDEQHRFGVRQRATFREKGVDPHLLLTTATPIPQTLSQTVYRDLDISIIDELPAGRVPIRTEVRTPDALVKIWPWLRARVAAGEQAFVVCPRIGGEGASAEDEELGAAAAEVAESLAAGALSGLRLGLLHGRLAARERDVVMRAFAAGEIDVLVATTVVEVGIDVPNATVMIVLSAERFGLATLHQLRGRVGRGGLRSYCVLVSEGAEESERLRAMVERKTLADGRSVPLDGFDLAKRDLEIRGAGEFLGERQHGTNELRVLSFDELDPTLVDESGREADRILASDPDLARPEHAPLAAAVEALWKRYALA